MIFRITFYLLLVCVLHVSVIAQVMQKKGLPAKPVYGLTIENLEELDTGAFIETFKDFPVPITLRIVFQPNTQPVDYKTALRTLHDYSPGGERKFYIMALLFDSQALRKSRLERIRNTDCARLKSNDKDYYLRAKCFVDELNSENLVDSWEVGNEVNGEWADESYKKDLPESHHGEFQKTLDKIEVLLNLVPNDKPLALTLSYMPGCGEWKDNALEEWIKHFKPEMVQKIDYVLISYYEDKCNYKILNEDEINTNVITPLRSVFKEQYIGFGEIGYSSGEDSEDCPDRKCYCSKKKTYCDEKSNREKKEKKLICKKSKISQMQRYYGIKSSDRLYIGGGFWWNTDTDYTVGEFVAELKNEFICLLTGRPCAVTPTDCH